MPFRVQRRNLLKGTAQDAPQEYVNRRRAFDAAYDNMGTFIKNSIRQGRAMGDIDNPPSQDFKYKIYVELRPQEGMRLELRYDYVQPDGEWQTNSIVWAIIEV